MKKNYMKAYQSSNSSAQAGSFSCNHWGESTETKANYIIMESAIIVVLFLFLCLSILLLTK